MDIDTWYAVVWRLTARHRRTIDLAHWSRGHLTGQRLDMTSCGLWKVSKQSQDIPRHPKLIIIRSNHPAQKREKRSLRQQSRQQSGHRLIEDGHVIEEAANRFISAKVSAHGFHGLHKSCPESGQHSAWDVFYNVEGRTWNFLWLRIRKVSQAR